ncbi:MAG: acetyltransferase [Woeseiaceae bacterium]|nr:acetyltransferase [Woeseiaceae bacterium]
MTTLYGIYGAGGCGRGILPVAERMLTVSGGPEYELVFIDDGSGSNNVNGHRVLSLDEFSDEADALSAVSLAVADPRVRQALAARCEQRGIAAFSVISPECVVMDEVQIGEGAVLSPFTTLTSNIRIGRHFHANLYSYVEHDCVVGDFVTLAPAAHCNGNVVIEDFAYLGSGCVIRQGTPGDPLVIGEGATIGMGAVVTKSVAAGTTVVGNPARPIEAR